MAVRIEVTSQSLIVSLTGLNVVWALKRRLVINRSDIVSVKVVSRKEAVSLLRWRLYGSFLPGRMCAGTFRVRKNAGLPRGSRAFMSVYRAKQVLQIITKSSNTLVCLEIKNPAEVLAELDLTRAN
jgi:hypothetical protein